MPNLIILMALIAGIFLVVNDVFWIAKLIKGDIPIIKVGPIVQQLVEFRLVELSYYVRYLVYMGLLASGTGALIRREQVWAGYYRSLWRVATAPILLGLCFMSSYLIVLDKSLNLRVWGITLCVYFAVLFLTVGYKARTTR